MKPTTKPKPTITQPVSRRPSPPAVPRAIQTLLTQIKKLEPAARALLVGVVGSRRHVADVDETATAEQHIRETGCPLATAAALEAFRIAHDRWFDMRVVYGMDQVRRTITPDNRKNSRHLLEWQLRCLTKQSLVTNFNVGGQIRVGLTKRGQLLALLIDAIWEGEIEEAATAPKSAPSPASKIFGPSAATTAAPAAPHARPAGR